MNLFLHNWNLIEGANWRCGYMDLLKRTNILQIKLLQNLQEAFAKF